MKGSTHQFIQHDQQPDSGQVYRITGPSDDKLTNSLSLQTRPTCTTANSIRRGSVGEGKRAVDDGNMSHGLRGNIIEAPPDVGLECRLRRRRVENFGTRNFDSCTVLWIALRQQSGVEKVENPYLDRTLF